MVTQNKTAPTEEQEDAIDTLRISLATDYTRFNEAVLQMNGAIASGGDVASYHIVSKWNEAIKRLTDIEDSIKRFREGRKQAFEE